MRGVATQVSDPKRSTACTAALKKNPNTRGTAPSLLRMHTIVLQNALDRDKFLTTAVGWKLSITLQLSHEYSKLGTILIYQLI